MYILLITLHVIACLILISVILLQAGRGGGLSETMGGGEAQSLLGTQAPAILKKATTISAILFLCTSLLLGIITARRGRSLFQQQTRFPQATAQPGVPLQPIGPAGPVERVEIPAETVPAAAPETPAAPASE